MKVKIHAAAGLVGFFTIAVFWSSTALSEAFGGAETIAMVKTMILFGMIILVPAMAIAGASGMALRKKRKDALSSSKKKRMPLIGANGLLILLPAAIYLQSKATAGAFDTGFYAVQMVEFVAGAANLAMMGLNIRDGLKMTGRIGKSQVGGRNDGSRGHGSAAQRSVSGAPKR